MYSKLTPESAKNEPSEFLTKTLNNCRPGSGAYEAAKIELDLRAYKRRSKIKICTALIIGAIGLLFIYLKMIS